MPNWRPLERLAQAAILVLLGTGTAAAQAFTSGSDGSDGALNIAGGQGTVNWDGTGLDADGDGVLHFTSVTIGSGTTLALRADLSGLRAGVPVIWLAQGDVTIDGVINLDGDNGAPNGTFPRRTVPGAGGYHGGRGAQAGTDSPESGEGPGAGLAAPGTTEGGSASYRTGGASNNARRGATYGNDFIYPLVGGSGGGGNDATGHGGGGGGGGGAILIASTTQITLTGTIQARGGLGRGDRFGQGHGSGGAIKLMAPVITATGTLNVNSGYNNRTNSAGAGRMRMEAYTFVGDPTAVPTSHLFRRASLSNVGIHLPSGTLPRIRVTDVAGATVPPTPTGAVNPSDVTISEAGAVTFTITAEYIPLGTTPQLVVNPSDGATTTYTGSPLTGTLQSSTSTVTVPNLPSGTSRFFATARWNTQ